MMHKYLIAAAALVLSPLAMACPECDDHHAVDVSYEEPHPVVMREVPAAYEVSEPRFVAVDRDFDYYASDNMRYHYTKPAVAYRLEREEDFDDCD